MGYCRDKPKHCIIWYKWTVYGGNRSNHEYDLRIGAPLWNHLVPGTLFSSEVLIAFSGSSVMLIYSSPPFLGLILVDFAFCEETICIPVCCRQLVVVLFYSGSTGPWSMIIWYSHSSHAYFCCVSFCPYQSHKKIINVIGLFNEMLLDLYIFIT